MKNNILLSYIGIPLTKLGIKHYLNVWDIPVRLMESGILFYISGKFINFINFPLPDNEFYFKLFLSFIVVVVLFAYKKLLPYIVIHADIKNIPIVYPQTIMLFLLMALTDVAMFFLSFNTYRLFDIAYEICFLIALITLAVPTQIIQNIKQS